MKAILAREPVGGLSLLFGDCNTPKREMPAATGIQRHSGVTEHLRLPDPKIGFSLPYSCLSPAGSTYWPG